MRTRFNLIASAFAAAVALSVVVVVRPDMPFGVRSQSLHAALETAAACVALLAALLAFGRFHRRAQTRDLIQGAAFLTFALGNLLFSVVPTIVRGLDAFDTWGALATDFVAAILFCVSAWLGKTARNPRAAQWWVLAAVAGFFSVVIVSVGLNANSLPEGVGLQTYGTFDLLALLAHPAITAVQVVGFGLYAVAVAGFWRHMRLGENRFAAWLAAAAVLAAAERLHSVFYPSFYANVVYSGDLLRLGFYVLVLVGAVREIAGHSRLLATAAVLEERRRMARDLHDGVAQELAFIHAQAEALRLRAVIGPQFELIASAARRALDESRRAIAALSSQSDQRLDVLLAQLAHDVETRDGIKVELDLQADVEVAPHAREELLRMAREAVANAARHSGGSTVRMSLRDGESLAIRVRDDGQGFDVDEARRATGRYGIVSMEERVDALGGQLRIRSAPGQGTDVEAVIPHKALGPR